MKKGRDLLNNAKLIETHPDLQETFNGISAIFGNIIFSKRMELGYTQNELAIKARVSLKTIARAEGGSSNLGADSYERIFRTLRLSPFEIGLLMTQLSTDEHTAALAH